MKTAPTIARYLLGTIFFVFGLNGFLHFIPTPPPEGPGGQFLGALFVSGELSLIMGLQLVAGAMLLANRHVPLALAAIGPVVVNILLFHVFMDRAGLPVAVLTTALWIVALIGVRDAFAGMLVARRT
ncbi:MAG TPA: DoxX family protein [Lacunisphaera sp.]